MGVNKPDKYGEILGYINITLDYDADSRLVRQGDGTGEVMLHFYDELGRRIRTQYPDGTFITYTFDKAGNVVRQVDRAGNVLVNSYDPLHRLLNTTVTRAIGFVGTDYKAFDYDALGRTTYALDLERGQQGSQHIVRKAYDSLGRVLVEWQDGKSVHLEYTHHTRVLTYPSGYQITYEYDDAGRLGRVSEINQVLAEYDYMGHRVHSRMLANGVTTTHAYDSVGRLVDLTHRGTTLVAGFQYNHYPMGETFTALRKHVADRSDALELDSLYRLVGLQRGALDAKQRHVAELADEGLQSQSWMLDHAHNWEQTTRTTMSSIVVEERSHNAVHQVTGVTVNGDAKSLVYDAAGNLVHDGVREYRWDYANRLREIKRASDGALLAVYEYDAFNRRVVKETTSQSSAGAGFTRYYHNAEHEVEEWRGAGDSFALAARYVYGDGMDELLAVDRFTYSIPTPVEQTVKPVTNLLGQNTVTQPVQQAACTIPSVCGTVTRKRHYYHQDRLRTVHAVTNEAGQVVEGYLYDAYGQHTTVRAGSTGTVEWATSQRTPNGASQVDNEHLFTGRRLDSENGLYHVRARYYSASLGRFLSEDPIGPWGDRVSVGNAYAFAGNGPYDRYDPTGTHHLGSSPEMPVCWYTDTGTGSSGWSCDDGLVTPDACAHEIGGRHMWTGAHSYATKDTCIDDSRYQCIERCNNAASSSSSGTSSGSGAQPTEQPEAQGPNPPSPPPPPPMPVKPARNGGIADGANLLWEIYKKKVKDNWRKTKEDLASAGEKAIDGAKWGAGCLTGIGVSIADAWPGKGGPKAPRPRNPWRALSLAGAGAVVVAPPEHPFKGEFGEGFERCNI